MISDVTGVSDDDGDERPIKAVYDQYWNHIRHVENEMWSFMRVWAIVITAVFTIIGADLPETAKLGAAFFGAVLSMLGFFTVYALRIPFFDFFLTNEAIAKRDLQISSQFRRLGDDSDFRLNKGIDLHDILVAVYAMIAGVMVFSAGVVVGESTLGIVSGVAMVALLAAVYLFYVIPQFQDTIEEASRPLREE